MDVDIEHTPRQHYTFGLSDFRGAHRQEETDNGDGDEVGLSLGEMRKGRHYEISQHSNSVPQLRRAFSFSVGDSTGASGSLASGARGRVGLAVNTNVGTHPSDQERAMSAGGIMNSTSGGGSTWDDLLEAAKAATEESNVHPSVSPPLLLLNHMF